MLSKYFFSKYSETVLPEIKNIILLEQVVLDIGIGLCFPISITVFNLIGLLSFNLSLNEIVLLHLILY